MEASEITRRNVAIAKFMGWIPDPEADGFWLSDDGTGRRISIMNGLDVHTNRMEFHKSWSWLMQVVERLSCDGWSVRLCERDSEGMYHCTISDMKGKVTLTGATLVSKMSRHFIEAVWLAVSDYCLSLEAK